MLWIGGGRNYKKCIYFVEDACEKQLIDALKAKPRQLTPGKVLVHNIIQEEIPRREINMIMSGTTVVFAFDTDVEKTDVLKKNVDRVKRYAEQIKIVYLAQVLNFEDEIIRATDVKRVRDLTRSESVSEFKSDFCRMKPTDCRSSLERHHFDISKLWVTVPPAGFGFVQQNGDTIKTK